MLLSFHLNLSQLFLSFIWLPSHYQKDWSSTVRLLHSSTFSSLDQLTTLFLEILIRHIWPLGKSWFWTVCWNVIHIYWSIQCVVVGPHQLERDSLYRVRYQLPLEWDRYTVQHYYSHDSFIWTGSWCSANAGDRYNWKSKWARYVEEPEIAQISTFFPYQSHSREVSSPFQVYPSRFLSCRWCYCDHSWMQLSKSDSLQS